MSANYFIGDTHFGHNKISEKFRKHFTSDEEHNQTIHDNILTCSGKNNQLWLLGDIFFNQKELWRLGEYARHFQNVHLVLGNHCHPYSFMEAKKFNNVRIHGIVKKCGMWITHAPVHPMELRGIGNVHGHTHNVQMLIDNEVDTRYTCVSCEQVDYKPISLEEVKSRIIL